MAPVSQPPPTSINNRLRCPAPISRLRVEKIEGGLMVAGVVIAANCQIVLPVFGFLFTFVGCVLTAASYRGPGVDEGPDSYANRIALTGNSRILGPACIVIGVIMLVFGVLLCFLTRRARKKEQCVGFHCPIHGDFYPLSPVSNSKTIAAIQNSNDSGYWSLCCRRNSHLGTVHVAPPLCPHSQVPSARSSLSGASPVSQCPTPQPFLVPTGSIGGLVPLATQLSPDQTFGSIRSLTVSRDIASFPLSRTPSPPPHYGIDEKLINNSPPSSLNFEILHASTNTLDTTKSLGGPRKSVSILLPNEEKG
ncbi:uncharacterized protein LOC123305206 isoform X2 [Chrysoperla carnea]|nr:uncharacterized protein LOC123305206 isoform X2 [Chrysoperla carnea]XP_044742789.1 uncharacterized protein LOC123305206 isoform X2 [Chrysoperla carnea]